MSKREQFSTTLPTKFINVLRKHALIDERITMSEMLERYQNAYLYMLGFEKGKNHCHQCGEKIKKFEEVKGILCQGCVN